jgi:hypothetical protein
MPIVKSNITLQATPTDTEHVPRIEDVQAMIGEYVKEPVRVGMARGGNYNFSHNWDYNKNTQTYLNMSLPISSPLIIDGVTVNNGDRVLICAVGDTLTSSSGIFDVVTPQNELEYWKLVRSKDFNDSSKIFTGVKVRVKEGATFANQTFCLVTPNPVLDTTPLEWAWIFDSGKNSIIQEKINTFEGNGVKTEFTCVHNLNSKDVTVAIYKEIERDVYFDENSKTYFIPIFTEYIININSVDIIFGVPPATGEKFKVIIRAYIIPKVPFFADQQY